MITAIIDGHPSRNAPMTVAVPTMPTGCRVQHVNLLFHAGDAPERGRL
jgi:hypothetical protein